MIRRLLVGLAILAALWPTGGAAGQEPNEALRSRAEQVVAFLRGEGDAAELFAPSFLAAVPETQLRSVARQLVGEHGAPRRLASLERSTQFAGSISIETERTLLHMNLAIEPAAPHRITGLLVTGAELRGDTLAAVAQAVRALPGQVSFAVARLGDGAPEQLAGHEPQRVLAIGSAFKLFILAELSRQVQAGQRRWSDVVALDRRSLPSGIMQDWPPGAPVTLHTLASLMISRSDNSATDTLLHLLGRDNVERMMTTIGVTADARNRPLLSTIEAFALKVAPDERWEAWRRADERQRRSILVQEYGRRDSAGVDPALFGARPARIDSIEWFASAADMVRAMDWLRRNGGETALAILAISPGIPRAGGLPYQGFKGGSEAGVINLTFLGRNAAGQWFAVAATWNDPIAPVENERLIALAARAMQLLR